MAAVAEAFGLGDVDPGDVGSMEGSTNASFVDGHRRAGGALDDLRPADFAKLVAALPGWFQGRRVLGDWPGETDAERAEAAQHVDTTPAELEHTLSSLPRWCTWAR